MKEKAKTAAVELVKYGLVGVRNSLITLILVFVCEGGLGVRLLRGGVVG